MAPVMSLLRLHVFVCLFLTYALPSSATLLRDPSELPADKEYDYIVVGSGNAGGVIASRLAEDPSINILVIEAGGDDLGDDVTAQAVQVPLHGLSLQHSRLDWNFTTTPQPALDNRTLNYPRGKVFGGSTTINLMTYVRGPADDYNRWAKVTGEGSWAWDNLEPYMRKIERITPPTDGHDTSNQFTSSAHGNDGPLSLSVTNYYHVLDDLTIKASSELPDRFPFIEDLNTGRPLGFAYNQNTIKDGVRDSVTSAYVRPALARGDNLDVLLNSQVLKISPTTYLSGVPSFRTVHFATSPEAPVHEVTARSEVIVSCGSISTPHLLQLSGIGDPEHLRSVGIEPIIQLPDVGRNLQDHALFSHPYAVSEPDILDAWIRDPEVGSEALKEWKENKTGLLSMGFASQTGWFRLPEDASIFESADDPSSGPTAPHFAIIFTPMSLGSALEPDVTKGFITISNVVASPSSRGSVLITSSDPWAQPAINLSILTTDFDMYCMREAIKTTQEFIKAPSLKDYVDGPYGGIAELTTDEEIEAYVRKISTAVHHAVGTARMASRDSLDDGVVNPDLTVKGTHGLRVIDASIFPFETAAHTMAPVYIVAERGADFIKAARAGEKGTGSFGEAGGAQVHFEAGSSPSRQNGEL